jgi:hypothetical protein
VTVTAARHSSKENVVMAKAACVFDEPTHTYTLDGMKVPSVTQIMSRVGVCNDDGHWNSVSHAEFASDPTAGAFGTAFHEVPECRLKGIDLDYDKKMQPWVDTLETFFADHPWLKTSRLQGKLAVEQIVYSRLHRYAGMFDWLARDERESKPVYYLIDWKTSTQMQSHWDMQLAAYEEALREMYPNLPRMINRWAVRIGNNKYQISKRSGSMHRVDWSRFQSCKNVFHMMKG